MLKTQFENSDPLLQPLSLLRGIGPSRLEMLSHLGIRDLGSLLKHIPFRYEQWGAVRPIGSLKHGEEVTIRGKIAKVKVQRMGWRRNLLRVTVADDSGSIDALFFNQAYLADRFQLGRSVALHGKVAGKKGLVLPAPRLETDTLPFPEQGQIVPIYPATEGVGQALICSLITQALQQVRGKVQDSVSPETRNRLGCFALGEAFEAVHRPHTMGQAEAGRRRLALQELVELQRSIQQTRAQAKRHPGVKILVDSKTLHPKILARLPFQLTPGQEKVIAEIRTDLASGYPMRRLLQGDVGSGKTAIAIYCCLAAIGTKHQAAFMAPTEILAEQHFRVLKNYLEGSKVNMALLRGGTKSAERQEILKTAANGKLHLLVGTHALIQDDLKFRDLALIVIDEQHRFGVLQREKLFQKGLHPHLLSMTATPIPRTLAMTVYGDLDISTLREKPPGRGKIFTKWVPKKEESRLLGAVREHLKQGDQVYWVTPRIEDESQETRSATAAFEKLSKGALKDFSVGLAHGKLRTEQRDRVLEAFRKSQVRVLVATTLIEVGIDVPLARVIVIEGAERLGLAQLHQLRGRVGRGQGDSYCFLMGSAQAADRFRLLESSDDGFEIAEADLKRRGPGDLSGLKQSGLAPLLAADLDRDFDLLLAARDEAKRVTGRISPSRRVLVD